jgi:hypothetical protein
VERLERGPLSSIELELERHVGLFLALKWKYETRRGYGYGNGYVTRGGEGYCSMTCVGLMV